MAKIQGLRKWRLRFLAMFWPMVWHPLHAWAENLVFCTFGVIRVASMELAGPLARDPCGMFFFFSCGVTRNGAAA